MKKKRLAKKLFHGTTEIIAKGATVSGIKPYEVSPFDGGKPRSICASSGGNICLTDVYGAFMAFDTCTPKDRWGIIEIDVDKLDEKLFVPHEIFLLEKSKKKIENYKDHYQAVVDYRFKLLTNQKYWKDSFFSLGLCNYHGIIPPDAISKISIFDWRSNWFITREVVGATISSKFHKIQSERHMLINRWMMCDAIDPSEWVDNYSELNSQQREQISSGMVNKSGLDVFFQRTNSKR